MSELILGIAGRMGWTWILLLFVWLVGFYLTKLVATRSNKIIKDKPDKKNKKQEKKK